MAGGERVSGRHEASPCEPSFDTPATNKRVSSSGRDAIGEWLPGSSRLRSNLSRATGSGQSWHDVAVVRVEVDPPAEPLLVRSLDAGRVLAQQHPVAVSELVGQAHAGLGNHGGEVDELANRPRGSDERCCVVAERESHHHDVVAPDILERTEDDRSVVVERRAGFVA